MKKSEMRVGQTVEVWDWEGIDVCSDAPNWAAKVVIHDVPEHGAVRGVVKEIIHPDYSLLPECVLGRILYFAPFMAVAC